MCTLLCRSQRHENIGVITVEVEEATQHFYLDKRSEVKEPFIYQKICNIYRFVFFKIFPDYEI